MAQQIAPLAGRHIVVTRPAGQAHVLSAAIAQEGGSPVLFPVLEIVDVEDLQPLLAIADTSVALKHRA